MNTRNTDSVKEIATIRMLIGGSWGEGEQREEVRDPYRGGIAAYVPVSSSRD